MLEAACSLGSKKNVIYVGVAASQKSGVWKSELNPKVGGGNYGLGMCSVESDQSC